MTPRRGIALAVLLAAPVLLLRLGALPLVDPDEGRYAWAARVMAEEGLSITPWFNDAPRFAKPAPITWLQALAMRALGEGELALRVPGALAALAAVGVTARLAAAIGGGGAGLVAGLALATSFRFAVIARQGLVDPPLQLALVGALAATHALLLGPPERRPRAALALHAWMALGVLLKGPLAALLPWLAIGIHAAWTRRVGTLRGARLARAALVFAVIALPYYVAMLARHGTPYLREAGVRQHVERALGGFGQPTARGLDYFPRVLAADLLPWTPAVLAALVVIARSWRALAAPRRDAMRLLLAWAIAVVAFFSVPAFKLPHYVLPAYPALAILLALALVEAPRAALASVTAGLGTVAVVAATGSLYLRQLGEPPLLLAAVAALAIGAAVAALVLRPRPHACLTILGVTAVIAESTLAAGVVPRLGERFQPARPLAAAVPAMARPGLYGMWSSAFVHYVGRHVTVVGSTDAIDAFAAAGAGPAVVLTPLPLLPELAGRGARVLARAPVIAPRLTDLWRPRPPREIGLVELAPAPAGWPSVTP